MPDDPHALIAVCFLANVILAGVLWATICRVAGLERRELERRQKGAAKEQLLDHLIKKDLERERVS